MRALIVLFALSVAGCATTATDTAQSVIRTACDQHSNCFSQNAVRGFEILDDTTLVAFVGAERCPYLVRLDGFYCNLRMSAYIGFRDFDMRKLQKKPSSLTRYGQRSAPTNATSVVSSSISKPRTAF